MQIHLFQFFVFFKRICKIYRHGRITDKLQQKLIDGQNFHQSDRMDKCEGNALKSSLSDKLENYDPETAENTYSNQNRLSLVAPVNSEELFYNDRNDKLSFSEKFVRFASKEGILEQTNLCPKSGSKI